MKTSAAIVGAPALGPPPFMHRPSAIENPPSPLSHHHLDSVHLTPGVITVGILRGGLAWTAHGFEAASPTSVEPM